MGPDSRQPARPRQVHFLVLAPALHPVIVRRQGGGAMNVSGTVPTDRASRADWVAVAAELAPAFAARAAAHDVDDRFVFENYAELRRRRMFSAAVPAELGGGGASHAEMCDVLRTLAHGCSSTALALSMHTHQVLIPAWRWRHERAPVEGLLRRLAADELILSSSGGSDWLAGSGRADKVDDGYRVTARKIFASGSPAADLFSTMAVYDDPMNGPTVIHFVIPLDTPGVACPDHGWATACSEPSRPRWRRRVARRSSAAPASSDCSAMRRARVTTRCAARPSGASRVGWRSASTSTAEPTRRERVNRFDRGRVNGFDSNGRRARPTQEEMVMKIRCLALALTVLLLAGATVASAHDGEKLGTVRFPVSCAPAVQPDSERAVALLHSFWYEEALKAFTAITTADATCAMGYWGIAMSVYSPLWAPPSAAMLEKGSAALEKTRGLTATPREKDYIAAIDTYYRDHDKLDHRTRAVAYEKAMEQLCQRYPDDREAAVFYALALNATAAPADKTYANQLKAGAILEKVFAEQPNHPGVAHYIIHSYDYPPLATRGLVAARGYARTAPSVPHAQHMPSHIFTRLGLWQESIDSNRASASAGKAYYTKLGKDAVWDQTLHALDYVVYAYLQTGQDKQARAVLEELGAMQKSEPESFVAAYAYAAIPARLALEQHRWSEAAALSPASKTFPWDRFAWGEAITSFGRAIGAARSGDAAKARAEVQKLDGYRATLVTAKQTYWAEQVNIQQHAAAAWAARAEGKNDEALKLMRATADLEDATEKHPVTPAPVVRARELLGELLLDVNQPAQALVEFEASAKREPNRFNGLFGAARAAELSGDVAKAKTLYAKLVAMCDRADGERPELRHAKAVLAK